MKIYDENGRHVGELYDDVEPLENWLKWMAVAWAVCMVLMIIICKQNAETGYVAMTTIAAFATSYCWMVGKVPLIMENADTAAGGIARSIFLTIICVPLLIVGFVLLSYLGCAMFGIELL